jgi:hypothetical protein
MDKTSNGAVHTELRTFFGNKLASFENGVQLDLRVKIAVDLIKGGAFNGQGLKPAEIAANAIDAACELFRLADERGLLKDLPDDDELTRQDRNHLRRAVRANIYQQVSGQKIAQEESPSISVAPTLPGRPPVS